MDEPMAWPEVGIVVVNWNNYEETAECLESLDALDYPDYRVIVVDNGSDDGSGAQLAADYGWCEVVFNDENLGFGGGCNSGIRTALEGGVQFVFLLNNDALVGAGFLREIVSVARNSDASVVGALVKDGTGEPVNPSPCHYPDMLFYSGYRSNLPLSPDPEVALNRRWWKTARVEGAGVLLPRDLLHERQESVGYFLDDSLFMYGEEIELGLWCRERNLESVIAQDAVVRHVGGASSARSFQLYYLTRNRLLIAHRYFDTVSWLVFGALFAVSRLLLAARFLKRRNLDVASATLEGLADGFRRVDRRVR